jgi:copper transport protein
MRASIRNSIWVSIALLLGTVALAAAHAEVIRSDPAHGERRAQPPQRVTVWFDEELDTRQSMLRVFDLEDRQVDQGDGRADLDDPDHVSMIVSLPELPEGVYIVRWKAVTLDDDGMTEGEFDFIVGNAAPRVAAPRAEPSPLLYLAAGMFVGLMIVMVGLVWRAARQ